MCHVFAVLIVCPHPSFTVLLKVIWSAVLVCTDLCCWNVGCPILKWRRRGTERKKQGTSDGVRGRDWGKESLQGKWMDGMHVEAQWMSCTLGWGVLQVLYRGSRGHSGCDWHQNNISWQTTVVKGRGQASTRRPHLEYQQLFLFMVNFVWLAMFFSFLFYWLDTKVEILLLGRMLCHQGCQKGSKTPMFNFENACCEFSLIATWGVD